MLTVPGGKSSQNGQLIRPILELLAIAWRTSAQNVLMHLTTAEHSHNILSYTLISSSIPLTLCFFLIFAVNSCQHSLLFIRLWLIIYLIHEFAILSILNHHGRRLQNTMIMLECCQPCSHLPCGDISVSCGMMIDRLVPCGIVLPWDYIVIKTYTSISALQGIVITLKNYVNVTTLHKP